LTPDAFACNLVSGRGNAVLHLQTHDAAPYRAEILNACLHCVAHDAQMNGDRAGYLFRTIQLTGELPFYRTQIFAALPSASDENYDRLQLFDLVGRFAAHGDGEARSLLCTTYTASLTDADGAIGDGAIIDLDGLQGFLFVADALGKLLVPDDALYVDDMPMFSLKNRVPGADLAKLRVQGRTRVTAQPCAVRRADDSGNGYGGDASGQYGRAHPRVGGRERPTPRATQSRRSPPCAICRCARVAS